MSNFPSNPEEALRKAILDKGSVIVTGTGVSISASWNPATSMPHPAASWVGLLENGLNWLRKHNLISENEAKAHFTLMQEGAKTRHFVSAAEDIVQQMGGAESIHFTNWLEATVGGIKAHNRETLVALEAIRSHGNFLATTNYDELLLDDAGLVRPITWQEIDSLRKAVRDREYDKVIFLHGYWRQPSSVILDWSSYEGIVTDEEYRQELAAIWKLTKWIYVGCGLNGLDDPDFSLLLDRYGKRARQTGLWDFCLVRNDHRKEFQAHFDKKGINIVAVPYGESHSDLPDFLTSLLPNPSIVPPTPNPDPPEPSGIQIPKPPQFYDKPPYIGNLEFVGRKDFIETLTDWASPTGPYPVLLFEAIGGMGKSILTWEWTTKYATSARPDWAGRFWYSFYNEGSVMADFCAHALAYMTQQPVETFKKKNTLELKELLIPELKKKPWLIILDGLERILVAYHRLDAAQLSDEEASNPRDKIANRAPNLSILPGDDEILRTLSGLSPSKFLITTRITPAVLIHSGMLPIPGVLRVHLPGLRPSDAEELFRYCGISGNSEDIRAYLKTHCDCHPLTIGVLAGLINYYLPDRGNFDKWAKDPIGGGQLNLADLDLVQKRNHILNTAFDALSPENYQLLSTLALLPGAIDSEILNALNPHFPPEIERVENPISPEDHHLWNSLDDASKKIWQAEYQVQIQLYHEYEEEVKSRLDSPAFKSAPQKLTESVQDLELRGLLQYDKQTRKYDLHPVVRSIAFNRLRQKEKEEYGMRAVDYFSQHVHNSFENPKSIDEMRNDILVVQILLRLGKYEQVYYQAYSLVKTLRKLENDVEVISLLKPFYPSGWDKLPESLGEYNGLALTYEAAGALIHLGQSKQGKAAHETILKTEIRNQEWRTLHSLLTNFSEILGSEGKLAAESRCLSYALKVAQMINDKEAIKHVQLHFFIHYTETGNWQEAQKSWKVCNKAVKWHGKEFSEFQYAKYLFRQNKLTEKSFPNIEELENDGARRETLRDLYRLQGLWKFEQKQFDLSLKSLEKAIVMARKVGMEDAESESLYALAKYHVGQLADAEKEADRLSKIENPTHRILSKLWLELGNADLALDHAQKAYKEAWANGEPFVHRFELNKSIELIKALNGEIPQLDPYDQEKEELLSWENDLQIAIEKYQTKNKGKK